MAVEELKDVRTYYVIILGIELYALEFEKIREIKVECHRQLSSHPTRKLLVIGNMELRRENIPIIDLNAKLGIEQIGTLSQAKPIIVMEIIQEKQKKLYGIQVDRTLDIVNIRKQDIMDVSDGGPYISQHFNLGQLSLHELKVKIIDIDTIFEN